MILLLGWFLVPVADVLGRLGATSRCIGSLFCAILDVKILVIVDGGIGQSHELVQYGEFKLQLDTVDHSFECRLDIVQIRVFNGEKANIHENDDQIDPDELGHDLPCPTVIDRSEQTNSSPHIDARDDEFLKTEGSHLKFLDHVKGF